MYGTAHGILSGARLPHWVSGPLSLHEWVEGLETECYRLDGGLYIHCIGKIQSLLCCAASTDAIYTPLGAPGRRFPSPAVQPPPILRR